MSRCTPWHQSSWASLSRSKSPRICRTRVFSVITAVIATAGCDVTPHVTSDTPSPSNSTRNGTLNSRRPLTRKPRQPTWTDCESTCISCCRPHPPSPFITISRSQNWDTLHLTVQRTTEGYCSNSIGSICRAIVVNLKKNRTNGVRAYTNRGISVLVVVRGRGLQMGPVTGKILSVTGSNTEFLT